VGIRLEGCPTRKRYLLMRFELRICNQMMNARDPMEKKKDDNQDNQANYWISMDLNPVSMK